MNTRDLLDKCGLLLSKADTEFDYDNYFMAIAALVKLRELLNSRPELNAGGAFVSAKQKEDLKLHVADAG